MKCFIFFIMFFFLFSCKKEEKTIAKNTSNKEEKNSIDFRATNSKIKLNATAKTLVETWQEYQNIAVFVPKYYKTTTKEALFNSQRLAELTQQLKDTIRIKKFDKPSFRIRLRVLHNEALRLADMDSISSITPEEVNQENNNIVNAFEAVKSKINAMVNKEKIEEDLKEFDNLFERKDTIKKLISPKILTRKLPKKKLKKFNKRIKPLALKKPKKIKKPALKVSKK